MKSKKFMPKDKKKNIIIGIASVGVLGCFLGGGYYWVTSNNRVTTEENQSYSQQQQEPKMVTVLQAIRNIEPGEVATSSAFRTIEVDESQVTVPIDAIKTMDQLTDKIVRVNIKENEILEANKLIAKTSWYEEGDRLVEINFIEGAIPTIIPRDQLVGTLVDIMLFKKGALDEVVVAKTVIVASDGNKLGFNLSPQEREYLKESTTEPDGLYLAAYLDGEQKASDITYRPSYENR